MSTPSASSDSAGGASAQPRSSPSVFARWLPLVVTIFGLALTALGVRWERRRVENADRQAFVVLTERLRAEIARRVGVYRYGLMGTRSVFAAHSSVGRAAFRELVSLRDLRHEFPGALGIGYIERVQRNDVDAFLARTRADDAPTYTVKSKGSAPDLFLIEFIEPLGPNRAAQGFDVGQERRRREAAEQAMLTGEACVTEVITLVQADSSGPGFLYLLPVYRSGSAPKTPDERRAALRGWVYMPLLAREIFSSAGAITDGKLDFEVFTGEQLTADHMVYDDDDHLKGVNTPITRANFGDRRMQTAVGLAIGGRRWIATMSTTPKFRSETGSFAWELALGGAALSLLLGLLLNAQATAGRTARSLAKAMTAELRHLATIVERSTNLVLTTDANRRITWVNDAFTRTTGYTASEVIGRSPRFLQCEKTDPRTIAVFREKLGRSEACRGEILNRGKHGNEYWLDMNIQPLLDEHGTLTGFTAIESDITDRKRIEAAAAESAALLAATNAALEEAQAVGRLGNWSIDVATRNVRWSKQLYRLLGVDEHGPAPNLEASIALFAQEDVPRLTALIERALREGAEFTITVKTRPGSSGARYLRCECRVRREGERVVELFGTVIDVTTEREREEELKRAQQRAEDASRSKSEFLANMSHEIRTPMAAILGYTELLAEEVLTGPAQQRQQLEYLGTIKRNGEHLLSIINDILDISKIEAGKMTIERTGVHIDELLADVVSTMTVKADAKGVKLACLRLTPIPAVIQSDTVRLRQVLLNLVGNAVKFTEVGSVIVRVAAQAGPPGLLRFEIADTGVGISPEQGARLFEAFAQADSSTTRRFGGSGLGLSISKRLAQMLGGDITFSSELGRGSVFTLTIESGLSDESVMLAPGPTTEQKRTSSPTNTRSGSDKPLAGMRVLLVEDGPDNQRLIALHLRRAGAEVRIADNGRLAIEALTIDGTLTGKLAEPSPFDVVLSDIQMPEMDGYTVVTRLREAGFAGAVVALTAHAMESDRQKCLAAGFDDHLSKPLDRTLLISTLARLMLNRDQHAAEPAPEPELPPLLSDLRDDPEMCELVEHFVRCLPERCAAVESAFVKGDYTALHMIAHGLKGAGGGFGFWPVTHAAAELERRARTPDDLAGLGLALREFLRVCRAVRYEPRRASVAS